MQGDPKVDELMRPVLAAIKRHVKNSDAVTDIYNRAYEAVMTSMDVKDTAKIFCPNCETETECGHTAELYECHECGEDFARYIVGRTEQSNSDVSMTQGVLTNIKTPFSIEDFRPYADRHRGKNVLSGPHWPLVLRYPVLFDEYEKLININAQEQYRLNIEIARLTAALAAANEDAERLADKLSEVVAYGGYYADIENRMPPDGQTFKVIAVSLGGVDDFTVLRMDGKLYFASDPPREVPRGFEIIRIKPWDVKTFGKTEEEDF